MYLNNLTVDINYLDAERERSPSLGERFTDPIIPTRDAFKEEEHPRAGSGAHAGEFVKKGGEGAGPVHGTSPEMLKSIASSPSELDKLSNTAHKLGKSLNTDPGKLGSAVRSALAQWTVSSGYRRINDQLRQGKHNPKTQAEIDALQDAIHKQSINATVHAYRGVHGPQSEEINKRKSGDEWNYPGFMSTTIDPKRATHFAKGGEGDLIHFVLPKGTKALYASHPAINSWEAERELTLPHHSTFRYLGSEELELPEYHYTGAVKSAKAAKVKLHHVEVVQKTPEGAKEAKQSLAKEPKVAEGAREAKQSAKGAGFAPWEDAPTTEKGWEDLAKSGPKFDEPELKTRPGIRNKGAGVLIREDDGRIWVVKPANDFGGFGRTFPKGGIEKGMSPAATALKECYEESGLKVELIGLAGDINRSDSVVRYYFAKRVGGDPEAHGWESEDVELVHPDRLPELFKTPGDNIVARDLLKVKLPEAVEAQVADYQDWMREIPEPHADSQQQQHIYDLAEGAGSNAEKIKKLEGLSLPKGGYSDSYRYKAIRALGARGESGAMTKDGLTVDINYLDSSAAFVEAEHPRDESGKFKNKMAGFTPPTPSASHQKYFKKIIQTLHSTLKGNGTFEEMADYIKAVTSTQKHPAVSGYANALLKKLEQHAGMKPGSLGKAVGKGAGEPVAEKPKEESKGFYSKAKEEAQQVYKKIMNQPSLFIVPEIKAAINDLVATDAPQWQIQGLQQKINDKEKYETPKPKAEEPKEDIGEKTGLPKLSSEYQYLSEAGLPYIKTLAESMSDPEGLVYSKKHMLAVLAVIPDSMVDEPWAQALYNVWKNKPAEGEGPKTEEAPKPVKIADLPKPHGESKHQQELYFIVSLPSGLSTAEKIKQIKEYPTVQNYPESYTAKYAQQLVAALGGKWEAPKPKPFMPQTAQVSAGSTYTTPSDPLESWKKFQESFKTATDNTDLSWNQEKAVQCLPTAVKGTWAKNYDSETREAVNNYKGGSSAINEALRNPAHASAHASGLVKRIHNAFQKDAAITKADMVVRRGMDKSNINIGNLKAALGLNFPATFNMDGFVSTSFKGEAAFKDKGLIVEILVPKGKRALSFYSNSSSFAHECEVVLDHGQSYQCLAIEEKPNGKVHIRAALV